MDPSINHLPGTPLLLQFVCSHAALGGAGSSRCLPLSMKYVQLG